MFIKYIVINNKLPVLFVNPMEHRDAAKAHKELVTSAGFCMIYLDGDKIKVQVGGESMSLGGIKAKPEDEKLIAGMLNGCL